jgi:cobalt-precorrin-7 (C5)-methyltransferase
MKIVGVGPAPGMLTEEAICAIKHAKMIYGSKRAIEIASNYLKCETHELDFKRLDEIPDEAVVLSTGDPMLSGLGTRLKGEVIPGISSLQLACTRLRVDLTSITAITAHGRDIEGSKRRILDEIRRNRHLFILPDPGKLGSAEISSMLLKAGYELPLVVLENLGYENETIKDGSTRNPPEPETMLYVMVVLLPPS